MHDLILKTIQEYEKQTITNFQCFDNDKYQYYNKDYKGNFVDRIDKKHEDEYKEGNGREMYKSEEKPCKISAVHSSAAMTFNMLGNDTIYLALDSLGIASGYYKIEYEKKLATLTGNNVTANLDAMLTKDDTVIFCEMKMTEWLHKLNTNSKVLKKAYLEESNYQCQKAYEVFLKLIEDLSSNYNEKIDNKSNYDYYDAWQMLKHIIGIYNYAKTNKEKLKKIILANIVCLPSEDLFADSIREDYITLKNKEKEEAENFIGIVNASLKDLFQGQCDIDFDIRFISAEDFISFLPNERQEKLDRYLFKNAADIGKQLSTAIVSRKGKNYTSDDIQEMCKNALKIATTIANKTSKDENDKHFYQQEFVNYLGCTSNTKELYTEVIADFLLKNFKEFQNSIPKITRERKKKPYKIEDHQKVNIYKYSKTNRREERMAVSMFCSSKDGGETFPIIGKIIDYQVPLKNKQSDKAGKIDLLSSNEDGLRILELKIPESTETMLRCVLEAYSYKVIADNQILNKSFDCDENGCIKACVFVAKGGKQYKEYFGLDGYAHPKLKELMKELKVEPVFYEGGYDSDRYILDNCITDSTFFPKP